MRNNTHISPLVQDTSDTICITNIPTFDIMDYNLADEKQFKRYIFDVERTCRNSYSYKNLIAFLREHIEMNKCSFYKNINNIDSSSIRIHIHHAPLTLFDIVNIVYRKRLDKREALNVNLVAKEVMLLHYLMLVGLIPLSETVHELVHNGYLFIPTDSVYGKYEEFIERYKDYIDDALMSTLKEAEEFTKVYDFKKNTEVLQMGMVYIDPTGAYEFPEFKNIIELMKSAMIGDNKGQ